ncbi:MAG TPA: AAA family ATPase [Candidatus Tumulicola sp.]|jgi:predicted ATPase/DNA-binding SARP family transcriptional activator
METAPGTLEVRLFGNANVSVDGAPIRFAKRATTLSLLAYLILKRGAPVARPTLAFTLFPDDSEDDALAELRRYLYLAAKALPARETPWIVADADTVRWSGADAACSVDVVDFLKLADDPDTFAAAVERYGGDLLEDSYDDWVIAQREHLRARYLDLLGQLIVACRRTRNHGQALVYATRLLTADPWREDVLRIVMAVRYAAGDSAGALAECARFVKRLDEEMGVAPMPETVAVRDAILANAPLPGDIGERPKSGSGPRGGERPFLKFAGREREIERLHALWRRAARGTGSTALIVGEGGVGKTRLCAELARRVEAEGGRVFAGGTSATESIPYQCLVEAIRSALPVATAGQAITPVRAAVLARVLPELRDAGIAEELAPLSAERETARLLDALADTIASLARPRPLLLILEDLHWAGAATLEAFARLTRHAPNASMLVLATCRDEEAGPAHGLRTIVRELRAEGDLTTVDLARLERADVAEIVAGLEGLPDRDVALADRLYRHTEGNPLFLSETIADVLERRFVEEAGAAGVNAGIARIIEARTARLGPDARAVVEVAAVAGHGCSAELVREVTGLAPGPLSAAFNELLDRRILREAGTRSGIDYVFTHHLIATAAYAAIDEASRKRRHARIAYLLERTYGDRAESVASDLARHFDSAGLPEQAACWSREAALGSAAVFAFDEAIAFASRALELETNRERRVALLQLRETWLGQRGDRDAQRRDLDALGELVDERDERASYDVLRRRMLLARSLGESDTEGALIERMSALAQRAGDARLRAETLLHRAAYAVSVSRQTEARASATAALQFFEHLDDRAAQAACLSLLVDITANVGDHAATREYLASLRERVSTLADRAIHAQALRVAAQAALLNQRYEECRTLTREVLPLTQTLGDLDGEALAHGRLAVTSVWLEDFDEGAIEFDRAAEILELTGNKRNLATTLTNRVLMAMRLGQFEEAQNLIHRSNQLFDVVRERRTFVANVSNLSFVQLQLGDVEGALRWAREAYEGAQAIAFPVFEAAALSNLGNAERAAGKLVDAIAHMETGLSIRRAHQAPDDYADDLADLTAAYVEAGRRDDALACARELAELAEGTLSGAFWPHYVLFAIAQGFRAGGDEAKAAAFDERARTELARFAATIHDPVKRAAFLAARPNAAIASTMAPKRSARPRHAKTIPSKPK